MSSPWEQSWRIVKPLNGGGQGDTFLVEHLSGSPAIAVLKLLKGSKASDLKVRNRMYREVASLRTLATEGAKVPHFHDRNTGDYENPSTPQYFVMEYVEGETLDSVIAKNGPLALQAAVSLALDLCGTLR